jgi:D-glycero-D-manno-heptose 1,7-bisphosphate phosphatase
VFLDRDGVVNRPLARDGRPYAPSRLEELEVLDGVVDACARLRAAGFALVVVTNQPEVARGTLDSDQLDAMHASLRDLLGLDAVAVCPHDDADGCACRKPLPGMVVDAAAELGVDLAASYLVCDRGRDVDAAHAAGCTAVFVDWGWDERSPTPPYHAVGSLAEAADLILDPVRLGTISERRIPGAT